MSNLIENIWSFLEVFCPAVMSIGGAGAIFVGIYKWWKKPDTDRDKKLEEHDKMLDNDNREIKLLKKQQQDTDEAIHVMMKSMLAIMSHAIDGDHIEDLEKARDDMHEYLTKIRR